MTSPSKNASFHAKLNEVFPGSVPEEEFVQKAAGALKVAGFSADNSIALVGVCRDEICDPFVAEVMRHFGKTFGIRGLGGFISCGKTGFGAAHAHSPVVGGRRSYVYFVAPHIAIDERGTVGLVSRVGIQSKSTACGALCAFQSEVESGSVDLKMNFSDVEQSMLKNALAPHLKTGGLAGIFGAVCGPQFKVLSLQDLTKLAEKIIVKEQLAQYIKATVDPAVANYAIVAGIQVHGPDGKTYFCHMPDHCITVVNGFKRMLTVETSASKNTSPRA